MRRLAIVVTHPIQYYAPVFKLMTDRTRIVLKVFYTRGEDQGSRYDPGFKREIAWDIPLLEGYDHTFVRNTSKSPGSSNFKGIINPTLVQEVLDWKPDAVLVYGWSYYSHLQLMRKLKGKIPILFRGDSHLLYPLPWWKQWLKKMVLTWVYRHVDLAFYVGTQNKQYYQAFGLKDQRLVFAPHAIDNERFFDSSTKNYSQQAANWRERLGFSAEDLVVLYAGKFEPQKNPQLLLEAIQIYNTKNTKPLKLLFVGNGILEGTLKEAAQKNDEVVFLNFQNQSQMPIIYRLGDILCLPSKSETWGLVINEALACNIPVIVSSQVGCATDLVLTGQTGRIFEANNLDQLLATIEQLVKEVQNGTFKNKPETFIQNWSFEKQAQAFEQQLIQS